MRNTVRREERLDLIEINRVGQNLRELIGRLRESRPAQDVENVLPRDFHATP